MRTQIVALCLLLFVAPLHQELQDKWFDSDGVKIRYVDRGAGPPVLLIHGYTRSVESNWIEPGVFADLVKDYRVIAFDLRGHGKSDKPHE